MSAEEKRAFIMSNHLCFGCYGSNHISRGCTNKRTCAKCNKKHPTALHLDNFELKTNDEQTEHPITQSQSSACAVPTNAIILHSILPVLVQQKGSDKIVQTYAFYDNGSSGCFLSEELIEDLGADGTSTYLQLRTLHGSRRIETRAIENIVVTDFSGQNAVELPRSFSQYEIPVNTQQIPRPDTFKNWKYLDEVSDHIPPYMHHLKIGLLIGNNCPKALEPLEVKPAEGNGPYATRLRHGWTINGPVELETNYDTNMISCHHITIHEPCMTKEALIPATVMKMFEHDFSEKTNETVPGQRGQSQEDLKFLSVVIEGIQFDNGHYEVPLPLRFDNVCLPFNRRQAAMRAKWQKKKMSQNDVYFEHYTTFMNNLLSKGYAVKVPPSELTGEPGKVWYLPHHGVYNPHKPDKIRVVFDASAKFEETSLNDLLLQGPDLTNSLIGVLCRFRLEPVAFMADLESMFYQVNVPSHQQDYLRFLWWPQNNLDGELQDYRMTVHLFGAVSSPSVANFVLKHLADQIEDSHGLEVSNTICHNFYVDDCLRSAEDNNAIRSLMGDVTSACAAGGFRLTKFICTSSSALNAIPNEERSKEARTIDLDYDSLPIERALGIQWNVETDFFSFTMALDCKPATRRGILSAISSIYDPLGFIAPCILPAKMILQDLCRADSTGWDDEVSQEVKRRWGKWLQDLPDLKQLRIERCLKPATFGRASSKHIHIFSDASSKGYGVVAYLRLCNDDNKISCSFLMGKAWLAPKKMVTIPHLELTAALIALKIGRQLLQELSMPPQDITYYTDSTTVLYYIYSEKKRFPIFVANRVQLIRDFSTCAQWKYVETSLNPADDASRGITTEQMLNSSPWLKGPAFLVEKEETWPEQPIKYSDPTEETDCAAVTFGEDDEDGNGSDTINRLINHFSDWDRLKRAVVIYRRVAQLLMERRLKTLSDIDNKSYMTQSQVNEVITVQETMEAETAILRFVQQQTFKSEIKSLQNSTQDGSTHEPRVAKQSSLYKLDPYLNEGLLRVGGRLRYADLPEMMKHPILLPHKSHVTELIVRNIHTRMGHVGRNHVLSTLREIYWVTHANATVRQVISRCVICRRERQPVAQQKMADLPQDRTSPAPPFTYCAVDYFGPYLIKEGRRELKRYGVLFTCLNSRAVHLETANTLDTDSCIHALRRFISRRGPVRQMRSDNGTNFVGTERELFRSIDQEHVRQKMLRQHIDWTFNTPAASHMGGVWERAVRTVRKILNALLHEFGTRLDDESLRTLFCEVECIVNSRPLTCISSDADDFDALSPANLLTMKHRVVMPPAGQFERTDAYVRRRWKRVQYLSDLFWTRWKREYLSTLQTRQKWSQTTRNMRVGDIVLLKDENTPRL